MAYTEVIADDSFRHLLSVMSEWYDKRGHINNLKVLYTDHIETASDLTTTKTIDLLNSLISHGHLSTTDLTILFDTINATKQFGLVKKITSLIPSCPNVKDIVISNFSLHRQKLIKLGMTLRDVDVAKISSLYYTPVKQFADSWSLIMDLEHEIIIREENMGPFIDKLNRLQLPLAVEALTEGGEQTKLDNVDKTLPSTTSGSKKRKTVPFVPPVASTSKDKKRKTIPLVPPVATSTSKGKSGKSKPSKRPKLEDFNQLLVKLSDAISKKDEKYVDMLRVLYTDLANVKTELEEAKSAFDLFQILRVADILKPTDISILFETIEISGLIYLKEIIKKYETYPDEVKITQFTPHRQRVVALGKDISTLDVQRVSQNYEVPVKFCSNPWTVITYLENEGIVSEDKFPSFLMNLESIKGSIGKSGKSKPSKRPRLDEGIQQGRWSEEKKCFRFSQDEIKKMKSEKIGEGGFGIVHKGHWIQNANGDVLLVAIKEYNAEIAKESGQGDEQFEKELNAVEISKHCFAVTVLGYCHEGKYKAILYPYIEKGDLKRLLDNNDPALTWEIRLRILYQICCVMYHFHNSFTSRDGSSHTGTVHGDVKADNIFLDKHLNAFLGDFGVMEKLPEGRTRITRMDKPSSRGYKDPDVVQHLSMSSDVYMFGVVVFRCLTSKAAQQGNNPPECESLMSLRPRDVQENNDELYEIVDRKIWTHDQDEVVKELVELDINCFIRKMNKFKKKRCTFKAILKKLDDLMKKENIPTYEENEDTRCICCQLHPIMECQNPECACPSVMCSTCLQDKDLPCPFHLSSKIRDNLNEQK